jgi:hypothetical protein
MKRLTIWLLAAATIHNLCHAEVTKLRSDDRKVLQDASRFHDMRSITNLPPAVVALCADSRGKIADPGQEWQIGCVGDGTLPMKRLIWAATAGEYHVVHYESGGIAHGYHVLVATFKQGDTKAAIAWHGVGRLLKDYATFLEALERNELDDTLEYKR